MARKPSIIPSHPKADREKDKGDGDGDAQGNGCQEGQIKSLERMSRAKNADQCDGKEEKKYQWR